MYKIGISELVEDAPKVLKSVISCIKQAFSIHIPPPRGSTSAQQSSNTVQSPPARKSSFNLAPKASSNCTLTTAPPSLGPERKQLEEAEDLGSNHDEGGGPSKVAAAILDSYANMSLQKISAATGKPFDFSSRPVRRTILSLPGACPRW